MASKTLNYYNHKLRNCKACGIKNVQQHHIGFFLIAFSTFENQLVIRGSLLFFLKVIAVQVYRFFPNLKKSNRGQELVEIIFYPHFCSVF